MTSEFNWDLPGLDLVVEPQEGTYQFKQQHALLDITLDNYKGVLTDNIFNESSITKLLERKVREAENSLSNQLQTELLWGSKAEGGSDVNLRESIEDAMDKHWIDPAERKAETMASNSYATFNDSMIRQTREEPTIRAARKLEQKRAKRVLNDILPAFTDVKRRKPVVIEIVFPNKADIVYRWAAIQGDNGAWYITKNNVEFKTRVEIAAHFTEMALRASKVKINGHKIDVL